MTENIAPNLNISTSGSAQDQTPDLSTTKPAKIEQHQNLETEGPGQSQNLPKQGDEDNRKDENIIEKIKNLTLETVERTKEGVKKVWEGAKDKNYYQEECEEMKEDEGENQVLEVVGENFPNLKSNLIEGMEECGVRKKSWTDEASNHIKHIISGPDALEVVANQEQFIETLNRETVQRMAIPKCSEHHQIKFVPKGSALCWEFSVESGDIEFILKRSIKGEDHQIVQQTVIDKQKYQAGKKIQGKWEVDENSTPILVFSNAYSKLEPQEIDFRMAVVHL